MISWISYSIIIIIQIFNNTKQLEDLLSVFFVYFPYLQALFLPFICILFIPEIKRCSPCYGVKKKMHRKNRIHLINNEKKRLQLNHQ
jgi:hypothetical protein